MKTSIIAAIIGAAALVAAQTTTPDLSALPSCALPCATSAMTNVDGCNAGEFACICKNAKFISTVTTCLQAACTDPKDLQKAIGVAQSICGSDLPSGAVSSLTSYPTGNATAGSGSSGNSTTKTGGSSTSTGSDSGASSTGASSNSAAGLVPAGFAVAAIFAGLLTL
ncbi:CFEM domain-domain-containing protein [Tuber borchii]|uniref:CFEM domain-domain-containing protein n=1 Tax=Tuber borchii TaxID=42251 RepID=A0A2T6ZRB7_TUBBO|nr:CFEM domain-domain-containing protein [Tuber borchii]